MASPNVALSTIPASIRKPGAYFEFNTSLAVRTLPANKQRLLIPAQRLAAGTAPAGAAVQVFSDAEARALFGAGSMAHLLVHAALVANPYVEIKVLPLDDAGGGIAAVSTLTLAGTATAAGTVTVTIGGRSASIAIASGTTAAAAASQLDAELDKQADWPFLFGNAGANVTATAKNKGTVANGFGVTATSDAAGLTVSVAQTTAGSNDPDLTTAMASVFSASDEIIVWPYANQTALTVLRTHLRDRSSAIEQRGCIGVYASTGTLSAATTLAGQINDGRVTGALLAGSPTAALEIAAAYASVIAFEEDPARPLNGLELTGVLPPTIASRLGRTEQEVCLANGVTPLEVGPGERVQIVRAITTYTLNAAGVADVALLDLTTIRTLDYVRKACRERIALRFPREKLSEKTPDRVRTQLYDVLLKLEELEIVEAVEANKAGLIVERDQQDNNRLNARIPTDVVNGLHVFAGGIDLLL